MASRGNREELIKVEEEFGPSANPNGEDPRRGLPTSSVAEERDEISRSVPSSTSQGLQEHSNGVGARKIDHDSMWKICKKWIRDPINMAFLLWISCVAMSSILLLFIVTGLLNHFLPEVEQRNTWAEVNNQILNALFTLMSLYQHPKMFHHLALLCRWKANDVSRLRKIYCKDGTYKPHEWAHMMVVVILLHLNCFGQYALCGLNWGYDRKDRPAVGVGICMLIAVGAGATAGLYSNFSPLGKDYEFEFDEEMQNQIVATDTSQRSHLNARSLEKRFSFASRNEQSTVEDRPEWRGGIFNLWDDVSQAYLSIFCSFCVFGWNMERLGFGNMYVHIATFLLFCAAPFWIFTLAAINIANQTVKEILVLTGTVLCVFGLLYGGFWRIQMRKRFNLPGNNLCCGKPAIADCAQWLCCCCCSLAQEVRTVDFYDVVENNFYRKQMDDNGQPTLSSLPREDGATQFTFSLNSPFLNNPSLSRAGTENTPSSDRLPGDYYTADGRLPQVEKKFSSIGKDGLNPPLPLLIKREDNTNLKV